MKRLASIFCCFFISLSVFAADAQQGKKKMVGNSEAGKGKTQTCVACHGQDGNSPASAWPSIAGQGVKYIVEQLKAYKSGARKDPGMSPMAAPLSEQDMYDLAAYYSTQEAKKGRADETQVELGAKIYRGGNLKSKVAACMGCHGPAGGGNPAAGYPKLSGQHADYTLKRLKAFQEGEHNGDAGSIMMEDLARRMTNEHVVR
ncbi:MAG: c-type cytochrome [Pseudomonadota bacterium]